MDRTFRSIPGRRPNGQGQKTPVIPTDGIPIIGQPFLVKGGFPTVQIQCTCDGREPILLIGNATAQCPSCKRVFAVATFQFSAQTGQIQVAIQHGLPREDNTVEPEQPIPEEPPT